MQAMGQYIMYDLPQTDLRAFAEVGGQLLRSQPCWPANDAADYGRRRTQRDVHRRVIAIFGDVAMIFYIVIWMFEVNWQLALVSFAILPLLAY